MLARGFYTGGSRSIDALESHRFSKAHIELPEGRNDMIPNKSAFLNARAQDASLLPSLDGGLRIASLPIQRAGLEGVYHSVTRMQIFLSYRRLSILMLSLWLWLCVRVWRCSL